MRLITTFSLNRKKDESITLSDLNISTELNNPIKLDPTRNYIISTQISSLSSYIPNVFEYGSFHNNRLRISRDGGVSYTTIDYGYGNFTIANINEAISNYLLTSGWDKTTRTRASITIGVNSTNNLAYLILDSTQLDVGGTQAAIDFTNNDGSKIDEWLGLLAGPYIADNVYNATGSGRVNYWGDNIIARTNLSLDSQLDANAVGNRNSKFSNILYSIPFPLSSARGVIIFPSYQTTNNNQDKVLFTREINTFSLQFSGDRDTSSSILFFGDAQVSITLAIYEI